MALAIAIANRLRDDEVDIWGAAITQLGDTITTLGALRGKTDRTQPLPVEGTVAPADEHDAPAQSTPGAT